VIGSKIFFSSDYYILIYPKSINTILLLGIIEEANTEESLEDNDTINKESSSSLSNNNNKETNVLAFR